MENSIEKVLVRDLDRRSARYYRKAITCKNCDHGRPRPHGVIECTLESDPFLASEECVCDHHRAFLGPWNFLKSHGKTDKEA